MRTLLILALVTTSFCGYSQIRGVPDVVKDSFQTRFPDADSVVYHDNLINVQVSFIQKGSRMLANFSNKGVWKQTEKFITYESLPQTVIDGFKKSKYALDWSVKETIILTNTDGNFYYRLKVGKKEVARKFLFFDSTGRLVKDSLAI